MYPSSELGLASSLDKSNSLPLLILAVYFYKLLRVSLSMWLIASNTINFWVIGSAFLEIALLGLVFLTALANQCLIVDVEMLKEQITVTEDHGGILSNFIRAVELTFDLLKSHREHRVHQYLWSERELHPVKICSLPRKVHINSCKFQHPVRPIIKIVFGLSSSIRGNTLGDAICRVVNIILEWRKAIPGLIHRKAYLTRRRQQFRIVLHHAFQSRRRLEHGLLGIGILGIDKLWNDTVRSRQVLVVFRDFENQRVRVSWEVRVAHVVFDITIPIPLLPQEGVKLIVLHIDDNLLRTIFLID